MPDNISVYFVLQIYYYFNHYKMKNLKSLVLLLVFSYLALTQCSERQEPSNCFPSRPINVQLNLSLPAYYPLQTIGGWIYVNEQESGTRGLIVVRSTNGFKVYDRNAPHLCPGNDTTLMVEKDIKIICPKDGAEWILLTGQPTKVANVAPVTFTYSYQPNINVLNIVY